MPAHFIVRAQVTDSDKEAFDRWYNDEHLPQAIAALHPLRAWRGWSEVDPLIHYAAYEFREPAELEAVLGSDTLKGFIAEFDRVWGTRVSRTREVVFPRQVHPDQDVEFPN
jgi:hypothetical protein